MPDPLIERLRALSGPFQACEAKIEIENAFPDLEFLHVLRLSGEEVWSMLAALTVCLDTAGARLDYLSLQASDTSYSITCRLSQLSSGLAQAVVERLRQCTDIGSVHLEHQLGRGRS